MNILLFCTDSDRLSTFSFYLEGKFGIHVNAAINFERAMSHLLSDNSIDLIVASQSDECFLLFKYLLSTSSKVPVIFLQNEKDGSAQLFADLPILAQISEAEAPQKIIDLIMSNYRGEIPENFVDGEFCRINVELLLRIVPLAGDVYVRLSKTKYIKLFHGGFEFTKHNLYTIWGMKKIEYLYIHKKNTSDFISKLHQNIDYLNRNSAISDEMLMSTVEHSHETVHHLAQKIGFSKEVLDLTKSYVELAVKAIGKAPKVDVLLHSVLTRNRNYISSHSILVANLACAIAVELEWPSESTFHKLILAGFLHDITLTNPEHAKARTKADCLKIKDHVSEKEFAAIKNHPYAAGEIVDKLLDIPADVCVIITQHHEQPDGSGFPRSLMANKIAPLAAVFIVAHDIIDAYLAQGEDFSVEKFIDEKTEFYNAGTFKKIAKLLKEKSKDPKSATAAFPQKVSNA